MARIQSLGLKGAGLPEPDKRSREELLADADKARNDGHRHRIAAFMVQDSVVEATLQGRANELETLAILLEAKANKTL